MPDEFVPPKSIDLKGIKPEMPKEPPKEVLERTFTMDDNLLSNGDGSRVVTEEKKGDVVVEKPLNVEEKPASTGEVTPADDKKAVEAKKETDDKKAEAKPILRPPGEKKVEAAKPGEDKDKEKKVIVPPDKRAARDVSEFSPEEQALLKQMSNEAFEFTTKLIKSNKQAAGEKNNLFLQHPEGYTITPEYKMAQRDVYINTLEIQQLEAALELCKEGKDFQLIKEFDGKTLQPVLDAPIKASPKNEEELRKLINQATGNVNTKKAEMQQMASNFQGKLKGLYDQVETERKSKFGWANDPKMMDYVMDTDNGEESIRQIHSSVTNIFPKWDAHPAISLAGDFVVALAIANAKIRELEGSVKVSETKREELKRAEPSSDLKPRDAGGKEINGVREFKMDPALL